MGNILSLSIPLMIKRLSMALTIGCAVYIVHFLTFVYQKPMFDDSGYSSAKKAGSAVSAPVFDLQPYGSVAAAIQTRDIFSSPGVEAASALVEQALVGKLPANFKVVGAVIARSSLVIIEDTAAKKTYFIAEGKPQAGINIVRVQKDRIIISYQGQDILIPIK